MERNPHKIPAYNKLLAEHLDSTILAAESQPSGEVMETVIQRIHDWEEEVGPASIQEIVAMSSQWKVSIDKLITRKITPELIKAMLDMFIIGQEEYKIQLSLAFFTYLMKKTRHGALPKSNLLVCGPSGSGKTYGMQVLCSLFNVPFTIIHCNNLVQEGIVGASLTDAFTSLLEKWTEEDIKYAVVCFDEFDKLFEKGRGNDDGGTYNARIVNEMLNIIDDKGEVEFKKTFKSDSKRISIPTGKMMFVFTGVFDGLRKKDEKTPPIGFNAVAPASEEKELTADDFIQFGIKPEIMGRIQNFVVIDALTEEELFQLFDMGLSSPFAEFERYFAYNDIQAILTDEGKRTLAKLAKERGLGVRGLKSLLHQALLEDMYDLEVGEERVLNITRQYIFDNLK
jgi:ATP-dependent Clp protease ATP-binding subunit ClpX